MSSDPQELMSSGAAGIAIGQVDSARYQDAKARRLAKSASGRTAQPSGTAPAAEMVAQMPADARRVDECLVALRTDATVDVRAAVAEAHMKLAAIGIVADGFDVARAHRNHVDSHGRHHLHSKSVI